MNRHQSRHIANYVHVIIITTDGNIMLRKTIKCNVQAVLLEGAALVAFGRHAICARPHQPLQDSLVAKRKAMQGLRLRYATWHLRIGYCNGGLYN